nr:MAG TPA: hypothetical protein [Caudoviricetes sp.]
MYSPHVKCLSGVQRMAQLYKHKSMIDTLRV